MGHHFTTTVQDYPDKREKKDREGGQQTLEHNSIFWT